MRFATVAATLLPLASSVIATGIISPSRGDNVECRRFEDVKWDKFAFEKSFAMLLLKDAQDNVIASKEINTAEGSTQFYFPAFYERFVKFFLVDAKSQGVLVKGEEFAINCDRDKAGNQPWGRDDFSGDRDNRDGDFDGFQGDGFGSDDSWGDMRDGHRGGSRNGMGGGTRGDGPRSGMGEIPRGDGPRSGSMGDRPRNGMGDESRGDRPRNGMGEESRGDSPRSGMGDKPRGNGQQGDRPRGSGTQGEPGSHGDSARATDSARPL